MVCISIPRPNFKYDRFALRGGGHVPVGIYPSLHCSFPFHLEFMLLFQGLVA